MTTERPPTLLTPGVMARELGEPLHRINNVLATRSHIRPRARGGTLRLYDRGALAMVKSELARIDARRAKGVSHG
jgi:hypothetical protein